MNKKCTNCYTVLRGTEKICPRCSQVITYKCEKCGKEMDDGKFKLCPICNTESSERKSRKKQVLGSVVASVIFVGGFIIKKVKK